MKRRPCPNKCVNGRIGGLTDPRSRRAVEVAERYADGEATEAERMRAQHESADVMGEWPAFYAVCDSPCVDSGNWFLDEDEFQREFPPTAVQAALLRDICGNPWRPVAIVNPVRVPDGWHYRKRDGSLLSIGEAMKVKLFDDAVLSWNGGTVPSLAQVIYTERQFDLMPQLADALEEAGASDPEVLAHCRSGGIHVRGCHVLDFLTGRE